MNQLKNLGLLVLNILILAVSMPILEYDLNKTLKPDYDWLPTYPVVDIIIVSVASIFAIYHIALLFLIITRRLNIYKRWIWFGTLVVWSLIGIMVLMLGKSFLPIYFPSSF